MRKKLLTAAVFIFLVMRGESIYAQSYRPVDSLSSIRFVIRNVGMETDGRFFGLEGNIVFNPADLKTASLSVSINAGSINTDIEPRDQTLREKEYLDVAAHPKISFESKSITPGVKPGNYIVKGMVSLKGISKEISFPFQVIPKDNGLLFTGEMKLNRRDFRIGMNSTVLSDGFSVMLSVFARKTP